jgi:acyl carrier protein
MTDAQVADEGLRAEVRAFLRQDFLYMHPDLELGDDDQLMELGLLDSLAFVELVDQLEQRYGIAVRDDEITEEHLGSVSALARFIAARRP